MINSISDYIMAATAGCRSYSNLHEVRITRDQRGAPRMSTSSRYLELEATWHGTPCRICCPLDDAVTRDAERLSAALKRVQTPVLAGYRLLPKELHVGNRLSDVVIEIVPEGRTLDQILRDGINAKQARRLASEWIATAELLAEIPFAHRALATSRIIVRTDGGMTLCGLHHGRLDDSSDDHRAIVEITYEILRSAIPNADYPPIAELLATTDLTALCRRLRQIAGEAKVRPAVRPTENLQLITRKLIDSVDFSSREWIGIPSEDRIAYREGGRYGYLNLLNEVVIEAQFTHVEPFTEGRAVVGTDDGVGMIDKQGRWVIAPNHEDICWSAEYNVATVGGERGWALYDSLGHRISPYYDYLGDCSEHRIAACRNERWGFIDTYGFEVVPLRYDDAFEYKNGRARVVLNGRPIEIDTDGLEII